MKKNFCFKLKALEIEWLSLCLASGIETALHSIEAVPAQIESLPAFASVDALQTRKLIAFPSQQQESSMSPTRRNNCD
jgi:hypothetical protein